MKPLSGVRIAVTRAATQAEELARPLEDAGAVVRRCPLIRIEARVADAEIQTVLASIGQFDWIVLTSVNGVEQLIRVAGEANIEKEALGRAKVACVGPATAAAAERIGLRVAAIPRDFVGAAVTSALLEHGPVHGRSILIARGSGGGQQLPADLLAQGADVVDLELYRSALDAEGAQRLQDQIGAGEIDLLTFTSGSAVNYFAGTVKNKMKPAVAVIGPSTAAIARTHGLRVDIEADPHTVPGLVDAILNYRAANRGIWRSDAGK